MRTIEEIKQGHFKAVNWIRHEARTYNEDFDNKLREILLNVTHANLMPFGFFSGSERFWEYYVHPDDEEKYQKLIKDKIAGIYFIE